MPTDMEGGNSIGLCTRTQRPDESKNQGHVQLNQEAAGLLWQRSAYRRTTFLFEKKSGTPISAPLPKQTSCPLVMLNMTKRQRVCFGCGAHMGVPRFFLI